MKEYGVPYMGSKSKIADSLLKALPEGKRFVDLFGGGFAMSECALRSGKYERVYYNDINPLITNLVTDSIKGKYNFSRFDAKWVDRETFHREKEKDGFIKYIWSFGNDGDTYFCGKDADEWKKKVYEFIVFGKKDPELAKAIPGILKIKARKIHDRRLAFQKEAKAIGMTEKQKKAYRLVHNKLTMNSDFDLDMLVDELNDIAEDLSAYDLIDLNDDEIDTDQDIGDLADKKEKQDKEIECPFCGEKFYL